MIYVVCCRNIGDFGILGLKGDVWFKWDLMDYVCGSMKDSIENFSLEY